MNNLDDFSHNLSPAEKEQILREFQFAITPEMANLLPAPAIAAQFIPQKEELQIHTSELDDPIGDKRFSPFPSLVHRYQNRVLWKITPTCAVYCRFCFRKEHIGRKGSALKKPEVQKIYKYLRENQQINEVILSGGDPLTLNIKKLRQLLMPLNEITHLRRLRIHSRIPIVAPNLLTDDFFSLLSALKLSVHLVIHINHSSELTASAKIIIEKLVKSGIQLYSQSVLLRGINDKVEVLSALMNDLLDCGVKPYYLHHLDLARGSSHFRVTLREGLELEKRLRQQLSGIAMPTYIVEIPNGGGKKAVSALSEQEFTELEQIFDLR